MRTALVTQAAPDPASPYAGLYNARLAAALEGIGHPTVVVVPTISLPRVLRGFHAGARRMGERPERWEMEGVSYRAVRGMCPPPHWLRERVSVDWPRVGEWLTRRAFARGVVEAAREFGAEALLVHGGTTLGGVGVSAAGALGVPFGVIEHEPVWWRRGTAIGDRYAEIARRARVVFGSGWPSVWGLREGLGLTNARYCPNGGTPATSGNSNVPVPSWAVHQRFVLCACSPTLSKGQVELVQAFAAVEPSDCALVFVGEQPAIVHDTAHKLGLDSRVRFLPKMPQRELHALMACATVYAMPSRYESFGMVFVESLGNGTPVILTSACGIAPMLSPEHGWVVPPRDHAALVGALRGALVEKSAAELERMGAAGRAFVRDRFTWEKSAAAVAAGLMGEPEPVGTEVPARGAEWELPGREE